MNWNKLITLEQLEEIKLLSHQKPVLIFKHSSRCSISSMSLDRLLRNWKEEDQLKVTPFFLDLIAYRSISNQIEEIFGVPHASPQILLIKEGQSVYDESHFNISYPEIMSRV
jgi:bacillithiol system protein YtxJ